MNENTLLKNVSKPGRYTGGEYGQILKDKTKVSVRAAFCFPDSYEIGMSNLGMRILYGALNQMDSVWCERCFAPWPDMGGQMKKNAMPLCALESGDPLSRFDFLCFTMGYELCYTNILYMMDLAASRRAPISGMRARRSFSAAAPAPATPNRLPISSTCFPSGKGRKRSAN